MSNVEVRFPDNVWFEILSSDQISVSDLSTLMCACRQLCDLIVRSNRIWQKKFTAKWPHLFPVASISEDWYLNAKERKLTEIRVNELLTLLSKKHCVQKGVYISDWAFSSFLEFIGDDDRRESFVIDELRTILASEHSTTSRLTARFYAVQAVKYIANRRLLKQWVMWLSDENESKIIENGAFLLAEWFQPNVYLQRGDFFSAVDVIAEKVRSNLRHSFPKCPCLNSAFDHKTISESCWPADMCKKILLVLNYVFTGEYNFVGDTETYYNLDNSLINKVIERRKGLPITLCILYHAVARRLGVYCEPVSFPQHFVLRFLEHPQLSDDLQRYTFIDVFNSCRFLTRFELWSAFLQNSDLQNLDVFYQRVDSSMVIFRMVTNIAAPGFENMEILSSAMELAMQIVPNAYWRRSLAKCYLQMGINFNKVIDLLQTEDDEEPTDQMRQQYFIQMAQAQLLLENNEDEGIVPKVRTDANAKVVFAVGMIMRHKSYGYTCVIIGWDPICSASSTWQQQMGVERLSRKHQQPFYHVLVNDGSNRYAAEENLIPENSPNVITHGEVGKYFDSFKADHYVMNREYARQYPDEEKVLTKYVS